MTKFAIACKLPNGLTIDHKDTTVTLAGANSPNARFGFGITPEVDADWWKDWSTTVGKDIPAVKNGSIFGFDLDDDGALRERSEDPRVLTGQEPLDPEAPAPGIEPTDEMKKELAKASAKDKGAPAARK